MWQMKVAETKAFEITQVLIFYLMTLTDWDFLIVILEFLTVFLINVKFCTNFLNSYTSCITVVRASACPAFEA